MPSNQVNREWLIKKAASQRVRALARELGLPLWAARVLYCRGLKEPGPIQRFLKPSLDQLPTPGCMAGLDRALEVLIPALEQGRTIGIAGDYDADGVTSTALLVDFFRQLGADVVWELPHRINDGYGFSPELARRLAQAGARVVVTVDSGIADFEGVAKAHELGLEVVVTDHHQIPPEGMVGAQAVINPQQDACGLPSQLAGVGVAFYLAAGLRAALRERGFFQGRPVPNLRDSLDLVALGTCADVVPLQGSNRILVREGLQVLRSMERPGLAALCQAAGLGRNLDARDLSFSLAPRINAPGRLDSAGRALELLLCPDPSRARDLAAELDGFNSRRKEIETGIFAQAWQRAHDDPELRESACLVMAGESWHRGVLGIVASRLVERLGRPAILLAAENGRAVGSGRSVPGFHMQKALAALEPLLINYGGHALAAGLTMATENVGRLARALDQAAAGQLPPGPLAPPVMLDAQAKLADLGPGAMAVLETLAPFGEGNPEPQLSFEQVRVVRASVVGGSHLKMQLEQDGARCEAIAFNWTGGHPQAGVMVDLAARPRISNFRGRRVELMVEDMRPA